MRSLWKQKAYCTAALDVGPREENFKLVRAEYPLEHHPSSIQMPHSAVHNVLQKRNVLNVKLIMFSNLTYIALMIDEKVMELFRWN